MPIVLKRFQVSLTCILLPPTEDTRKPHKERRNDYISRLFLTAANHFCNMRHFILHVWELTLPSPGGARRVNGGEGVTATKQETATVSWIILASLSVAVFTAHVPQRLGG